MKIAFISGPYRSDTPYKTLMNIAAAESTALALWKIGYSVICPHKNSSWFDGVCEDIVLLSGYLEILQRCDLLVLFGNWFASIGSVAEHKKALDLDIPIFLYPNNIQDIENFLYS